MLNNEKINKKGERTFSIFAQHQRLKRTSVIAVKSESPNVNR